MSLSTPPWARAAALDVTSRSDVNYRFLAADEIQKDGLQICRSANQPKMPYKKPRTDFGLQEPARQLR